MKKTENKIVQQAHFFSPHFWTVATNIPQKVYKGMAKWSTQMMLFSSTS